MKHFIPIVCLCFLHFFGRAQTATIHNNGATLHVSNGATLKVNGSLTNNSGTLANNGTLVLAGNFTNNATVASAATSTLRIEGSSGQTFDGTAAINAGNVVMNNPAGLTLWKPLQVDGGFTFSSGHITGSGANHIIFTANASVVGTATDASHLIGFARKLGTGSFTYPVGRGGKYQPIAVNLSENSGFLQAGYIPGDAGTGPFSTAGTDPIPLTAYNTGESWSFTTGGTVTGTVTVFWDGYKDDFPYPVAQRRVARKIGNGMPWLNMGGTGTGTTTTGSITSATTSSWGGFIALGAVPPLSAWYRDLDKDGFGDPAVSQQAAEQPAGYVADNTDCDDGNPEINPNTTWYIDSDDDGYTVAMLLNVRPSLTVSLASIVANPGMVVQCTRPEGGKLPSELKGYGDCDDNNNAVHPGATETAGNGVDEDCDGGDLQTWFQDFDGDGFGNKEVVKESNTQPDGFVADNNDCDDTRILYEDKDADGFGSEVKVACHGADNNKDCDDNVFATVINRATLYVDNDGDGFTVGNGVEMCYGDAVPTGYSLIQSTEEDCDDTDASEQPGQTWYIDRDGDGYTAFQLFAPPPPPVVNDDDGIDIIIINPSVVVQCERPEGGKLASELKGYGDCNDNNQDLHPGATEIRDNGVDEDCDGFDLKTWYEDKDGDGFGNKEVAKEAAEKPDGYVGNNTDCNDGDNTVWRKGMFFVDADKDGFVFNFQQTEVCYGESIPEGYTLASNGLDCNDNLVMYADYDNDGFGSTEKVACHGVGNSDDCNNFERRYEDIDNDGHGSTKLVACGGVTGNQDCNDNDAKEKPFTNWYIDADRDGYANPGAYVQQCARPVNGFLASELTSTNGDCNDNNPWVWRSATLYVDSDGDGLTFGGGQPVCYGATFPDGFQAIRSNMDDCNDNNAAVWRSATLYVDSDGDGFTTGGGQPVCYGAIVPDGFRDIRSNMDDCNDNNAAVWRSATLYVDSDGDGFTTGGGQPVCYGATVPDGFRAIRSNMDDCNDGDKTVWRIGSFFRDGDGDGYTVGGGTGLCYGETTPVGYTATFLGNDCNDNDADQKPGQTWYQDADNDGYTAFQLIGTLRSQALIDDFDGIDIIINPSMIVQCERPVGYKLATELTGYGDCNDNNNTLHPGAIDIAGNNVDEDCDGFDLKTWYEDKDNDGFGNGAVTKTANTKPGGYVSNNTDCNDSDGSAWRTGTFYRDQDGDTHTVGAGVELCYGNSVPTGYAALSSTKEDCDDNNKDRSPGAVEVCGNGIDDNCNGSIDEGCFTNRSMKVNLFGGVNPYLVGGWNNWNVSGSNVSITSQNYQYSDGSFSTVNGTLSGSQGISDNGASYGGTMCPPEVLRYASYSTGRRTLTFKGLNNLATYSLELYASRGNTGNATQFTIGTVTRSVVSDNNKNNKVEFSELVPVDGQIVVTINRVGSFSYVNGFILTETKVVDGNKAPVAKAGGPTTITLPVSEVTASGSASSDPDGTIISYQWNQVAGPAAATIVSPLTAGTGLKNLVLGSYKFLLTVTDNKGETGIDTLFVTVNPEPGVTTRSMKVNLFGGVNPFANTEWNNWNVTGSTNITSGSLRFSDGTASAITSVLSGSHGVSDNGTTYGGAMCPSEVLRYASYSTGTRTLTLRGLNNALTYDLELYASRGNTGNTTQFTTGGVTKAVVTDNNKTNKVLFTGLVPVNGQIVLAITRSGTFTYLNGFILTEKTPAVFTEAPLVVARPQEKEKEVATSEAALSLSAYPNPFHGELQIRYTVVKKARVSIRLYDLAGREMAQVFDGVREPGSYTATYNANRLAQGIYYCRMITPAATGGQQSKSVKLVKAQ